MSIVLSVGIPTYNGRKYISDSLDSVIANIAEELKGEVEIIVSDNGSNDGTGAVVQQYVERYPSLILYRRNETNIGFDLNVDSIFRMARGSYVQILGDDDFLHDRSIEKILRIIKTRPRVAVILLSVDFLNIETQQKVPGQRYQKDTEYSSGDEFFIATGWGTAPISSLVIKRGEWLKSDLAIYRDTQWIHVGAVLEILKRGNTSYVITEDLVTVRTGNPRWSENFGNQLKAGMEHLILIRKMISLGYRSDTFNVFLNDRFAHNLKDIAAMRGKRAVDNIATAKLMVTVFYKKPAFWIVHLPILLIPYPLFVFLKALVRRAKSGLRRSGSI